MKSLFTIFILLSGFLTTNLLAQPWVYNFGADTGSFNTAGSTSGFLPDPPTGGGTDQVRVGDAGGGFALVDPGSDSELQITASTGTSNSRINKFSVYDYTPGTSFSIGFNIRFECDSSDYGRAYFFIGNGDYFIDTIRWASDLYTGIRWKKEASNSFLDTGILNALGADYDNINEDFSLSTEYFVEMFGNNTGSPINYNYNGTQTLNAYSYDLWIDGAITSVDNRLKSSNATIVNGASIDSYMILAEGSADNNLVVIVDDFNYSNHIGVIQLGGILANIKVFLEGPYNGSGAMTTTLDANGFIPLNSNDAYSTAVYGYNASTVASIPNADIVDWVLVELRTGTAPETKVGTRAAFLTSDGTIVDIDGSSPVTFTGLSDGNYYVVVWHRNHLAIMSASAIPLNSGSALYDFSTAQLQAFGTNPMKDLGGGNFGMMAGDIDGDGNVDYASDLLIHWLPLFGFSGYYSEDINLNADVDYSEDLLTYWLPNFGFSSQVP